MKKLLRYAHYLTLVFGGIGMLLMVLLRAGGVDKKGLYPASHPAWSILFCMTLVLPAFFWLLCKDSRSNTDYRSNFPPSLLAAVACVLAAAGLITGSIAMLGGGKPLDFLTALIGILAAALLLYGAFCRFTGERPRIPVKCLPCFFFALQLFSMGNTLGAEPEMMRYLFPFLSSLAMIPACYWLWSFEVDMGNRPKCLFWCLCAIYCNLVTAIGSDQWFLHLSMALWLLTSMPRLKYTPKRLRPTVTTRMEDAPLAPPQDEHVVAEVASHSPAVADVDAILDQILREYSQDSTT
jgi:hypothetical protein